MGDIKDFLMNNLVWMFFLFLYVGLSFLLLNWLVSMKNEIGVLFPLVLIAAMQLMMRFLNELPPMRTKAD